MTYNNQYYKLKTPAAVPPVTTAIAKAGCRLDADFVADDELIASYVLAATDIFTQLTGVCPITQVWELAMNEWPTDCTGLENQWWDGVREGTMIGSYSEGIVLDFKPLQSVDVITTYDDLGTATVFDDAAYMTDTFGHRVVLNTGYTAPIGTRAANAIVVEFTAGFGDEPADVPNAIRQGIIQLVAFMYEHRGDELLSTTTQGRGLVDTGSGGGWNGLPAGVQTLWGPWRRVAI